MKHYLLIGSRDPFEHAGVGDFQALAQGLADAGARVTLFLVENGVLAARRSSASDALSKLADAGVSVLADGFSMRERGVAENRLARGVRPTSIEAVVEQLENGATALWH